VAELRHNHREAQGRVRAGAALAVDREKFAELITERIEHNPNIELVREEVKDIPADDVAELTVRAAVGPAAGRRRSLSGAVATARDTARRMTMSA